MCGIAGIVGMADAQAGRVAVTRMIETMARRGPDAEGIAELPGAVLGHRRLAIFDLSEAGAQPMTTADAGVWVVFNGAIYNFKELRAELTKRGYSFRGASDTEVLLHGYRAWGVESLARRLRGMFAFALWDGGARKLFLVRDRLGVKPLVFAIRGRELAFASTARALKRGGYAGSIDENALVDLLRWGFVREEHCIYREARKLPPATIFEWSNGVAREYRFWEAPAPTPRVRGQAFGRIVDETEERLRESVALRLDADVPVAVLLSGGIDSSLICWAMAERGADLTAYTVAVPGDPWDESGAAVATARQLGIRHEVLPLSGEQAPDFDEFLSAYDEPFASSSALGMLSIARAVRANAKVVLTGDGGDDLFLGYPRHRHLWLAEKLTRCVGPETAQVLRCWGKSVAAVGPLRRAGALVEYTAGGVDAYVRKAATFNRYRDKNLLGPRWRDLPENFTPVFAGAGGMVETLVEFERNGRFVGEYLKKVDGATMHHGIEARSPFLDQELWQFASALPVDLRLHRGELKAVLRTLARRRLGINVAMRRKRGFRIPAQRWLATVWLERAEQTFHRSILARSGWIQEDNVLAELHRSAHYGQAGDELWNLFVLESWLRQEKGQDSARLSPSTPASEAQLVEGIAC
jgi:asparagine synthase (glutamine-hydrolysing)